MEQSGEMKKRLRLRAIWPVICIAVALPGTGSLPGSRASGQTNQHSALVEKNREKAHLRQEFARHFRAIQVTSQELVRELEGRQLSAAKLARGSKGINKSARNLRQLLALGELAREEELKTTFASATEFEEAIRLLATRVREFVRNPLHQNSRILDTNLATTAQTDLLTIIRLSKAINQQAGRFPTAQPPSVPLK